MAGGLGQLSKQRKVTYIQGRRRSWTRRRSASSSSKGGTETLTFEHAIIATGSRPATVPGLVDRQPARDGFDGRARSARHPEVAARRRRRLHRPRARLGLRRARHEGHGRRDDAGAAARRRSRSGRRSSRRRLETDAAQDPAQRARRRDEGRQERRQGRASKARGWPTPTRSRRSIACSSRSAASRTPRCPASTRRGEDRRPRLHPGRRVAADRRAERSSRSATSSASRCSRTRRRTRRASPSKRSLGHKVAFEPQAIPAVVFTDPEVAWCGLTETDAQKQGRKVEIAKFPWAALGRAVADRSAGRADQARHRPGDRAHPRRRHRRRRRRRADCRRRARGRDGRARDRPQAEHPPAPDAVGDAHGGGRGLLRPLHARLPAEATEIGRDAGQGQPRNPQRCDIVEPSRLPTVSDLSSPAALVRQIVAAGDRRRRSRDAVRVLSRIAPPAAVLVLVAALLGRLAGWPPLATLAIWGVAAMAVVVATLVICRLQPATDAVASRLDADANLAGELRSAWWFASAEAPDEWTAFHVEQAAGRGSQVDWRTVYAPVAYRRAWLATAALSLAAFLVPVGVPLSPSTEASVPSAAENLAAAVELEALPPEVLERVLELLARVESGAMSPEDALARLRELSAFAKLETACTEGACRSAAGCGERTARHGRRDVEPRASRRDV